MITSFCLLCLHALSGSWLLLECKQEGSECPRSCVRVVHRCMALWERKIECKAEEEWGGRLLRDEMERKRERGDACMEMGAETICRAVLGTCVPVCVFVCRRVISLSHYNVCLLLQLLHNLPILSLSFFFSVAALQRHPLFSVSILKFSWSIFIVMVSFYFWKSVACDTVFLWGCHNTCFCTNLKYIFLRKHKTWTNLKWTFNCKIA